MTAKATKASSLHRLEADGVDFHDAVANAFLQHLMAEGGGDAVTYEAPPFAERIHDFMDVVRREEQILRADGFLEHSTVVFHDDGSDFDGPMPDRIGRYEIERRLGRGGMGIVYLASDTTLPDRRVVIKTVRAGLHARADVVRRLRREAEVTARLDDDAICPTYETIEATVEGDAEPRVFVVMRYVPGLPLNEILRDARARTGSRENRVIEAIDAVGGKDSDEARRPDESSGSSSTRRGAARVELLGFVERIARAVHVAHEAGIIHRDIKPGNVMVRPDGRPVLLDFGLALDVDSGDPRASVEGVAIGTPSYMAPEQAEGRLDAVDRRTDVHALGVLLYEMMTGTTPFKATTASQALRLVIHSIPRSPKALNAKLPNDLDAVTMKALAKRRGDRFATAADFADELERLRFGESTMTRPPTWIEGVVRFVRRRPAVAALIGIVVLVGSVAVWKLGRESEGDARQRAFQVGYAELGSMTEAERRTFVARFTDDVATIDLLATDPRSPEAVRSALEIVADLDRTSNGVLVQPKGLFGELPRMFEFQPTGTALMPTSASTSVYRLEIEHDGTTLASLVVDKTHRSGDVYRVSWPKNVVIPSPAPDDIAVVRWRVMAADPTTRKPVDRQIHELATFYYAPTSHRAILDSLRTTNNADFDRLARAAALVAGDDGFGHAALRELDGISASASAEIRDRIAPIRLRALVLAHRSVAARALAATLKSASVETSEDS